MKYERNYESPFVEVMELKTEGVLCGSGELEAPGFAEGEEIM